MDCAIKWCNENQGFISAILALATLFISAYAIYKSTQLQKKIHNRDVQLAYQDKIWEIYIAYCKCGRVLIFDEYLLKIKMGFYSEYLMPIEDMLKQQSSISRIFDEANLIFDGDKELIDLLKELKEDFLLLSDRFIELCRKSTNCSLKAIAEVRKAFPELEPFDFSKMLDHPEACVMYSLKCSTDETIQWEKDTKTYLQKFSYEKFDLKFKKYLIIKKL